MCCRELAISQNSVSAGDLRISMLLQKHWEDAYTYAPTKAAPPYFRYSPTHTHTPSNCIVFFQFPFSEGQTSLSVPSSRLRAFLYTPIQDTLQISCLPLLSSLSLHSPLPLLSCLVLVTVNSTPSKQTHTRKPQHDSERSVHKALTLNKETQHQ